MAIKYVSSGNAEFDAFTMEYAKKLEDGDKSALKFRELAAADDARTKADNALLKLQGLQAVQSENNAVKKKVATYAPSESGREQARQAEIYREYGDIDAAVANAQLEADMARRQADYLGTTSRVKYAEDFGVKSVFDSQNYDTYYNWANRTSEDNYMTDEERGVYNYIYATEGAEAARAFLDSLTDYLNQREGQAKADEVEGNFLGQMGVMAEANLDRLGSNMASLFNDGKVKTPSAIQYASAAVDEDLADVDLKWYNFAEGQWQDQKIFGRSLGQLAGDAVGVTAYMAPSIAASLAVGTVSKTAGAWVGNILMGSAAAGGAYQDMLNQGYSQSSAASYGILSGLSEMLLEKMLGGITALGGGGLSKSSKASLQKIDNVLSRFAQSTGGDLLIKAGKEGMEEGIQSILEPYFHTIVTGEDFTVEMEEALYSALMGFVTGGVFEGVPVATKAVGSKIASGIEAKKNAEVDVLTDAPQQTAPQSQSPQSSMDDLIDEAIARATNAPADPLGAAVEGYKATGTVTNKQAQDILNNTRAITSLLEQTGIKLPDTASGRRNAVKQAVAQLAQQAQTGSQADVLPGSEIDTSAQNAPAPEASTAQPQTYTDKLLSEISAAKSNQQTIDTAPNTDYDNQNTTGGMPYGTGEETLSSDPGRIGQTVAGSRQERQGTDGFRSAIRGREEATAQGAIRSSPAEGALTTAKQKYTEEDYFTPEPGSPLEQAQQTTLTEYGVTSRIIKQSSWKEDGPAASDGGIIYFCETIDTEDLPEAIVHELVHVMKQNGFQPYLDFVQSTPDCVDLQSPVAHEILKDVANHRKIDYFSMEEWQVQTLYDELNAAVYGAYKIGQLDNSANRARIADAFYDLDDYLKSLDNIYEQYKAQFGGQSPTTSVGAAPGWFDPNTRLQYEHGTIPEGENPVRSDDLPKRDYVGNPVSRTARTVKGAKVTPDEFVDLLNKEVTEGTLSYVSITNSATTQKAVDYITKEGWDAARYQWSADVRAGKTGADMAAVGALLLNNAAKAGDRTAWLDILTDYQALGTNTAQGLQALRILKTLEPSDKLHSIRRSVKRMVQDMHLDSSVTIDPELEAEYRNAKTDEQRDKIIAKIQKNVASQIPSTLLEKWTALRYVNMLGNFRTQARNVIGNASMKAVNAAKNAVATGLEAIASKVSGGEIQRTKSLAVSRELLNAAKADFDTVRSAITGDSKYGDSRAQSTEFAQGVQRERQVFKNKALEGYRKLTSWAMEQGDLVFSKSAYARALAGYLKANGVSGSDLSSVDSSLMDDARLYAIKEAQEVTFRDSNALSDWVSKVGRRKDTPAAVKAVSEGVMPFRKTPANVLMRAEEYSPLGIINSVTASIKAMQKDSDITAAQVVNSWAKTITGTGIFALGMLLNSLGCLTAGADEDEDKDAFDSMNGWQNYALVLPSDINLTIDSFTPAAMPLLMGAELMELMRDDGLEVKDIEAALTSIAEPMVQMSMLQGVNDALDGVQYAENNLGQLLVNSGLSYLTQGLTNTLAGQLERTFEDSRMTTYVDKNSPLPAWLQRTLGKASAKIPILDYNQIPYINAWGEEEENPEWIANGVYNLLSPSYIEKGASTALTEELNRLNEAQSDINVYPSAPDKTITYSKKERNLSADEYVALAKSQGQTQKRIIEDIISSADYAALSDADKAKAISYAYDYARDTARIEVFDDYPGYSTKWMDQIDGNAVEIILRQAVVGTTEKYTDLPISAAAYTDELLKSLQKEIKEDGTSYSGIRDIQKMEAVVADDSLTAYTDALLRDIMPDSTEAKYDNALNKGFTAEQFVGGYRQYLDPTGEDKRLSVIRYCQREMGMSYAAAKKLYEIYNTKATED